MPIIRVTVRYCCWLLLLLFPLTPELHAQQLLVESFEGNFPPPAWTSINAGTGNSWSQHVGPGAASGNKAMKYIPASNPANAWMISPSVSMEGGRLYRISYFWKSSTGSNLENVDWTIGRGNTIADQSTVLRTRNTFLTSYLEDVLDYMPDISGNYNLGFHCYSPANQKEVYIDSVVIQPARAMTIYVKENATGANNGTSWANAYTSIRSAIAASIAGDTIKVAEGSYKSSDGSRNASLFVKSYTILLGGFPNTGNPGNADRDWARHPTILTGKLNPTDVRFNARNVLYFKDCSDKTILDGFVIQDGYADEEDYPFTKHFGAAIDFINSNATVRNCVFRKNIAENDGCDGSILAFLNNSNPTVMNCYFMENGTMGEEVSGVYINNSKGVLANCVFYSNTNEALIKMQSATTKITNCNFVYNTIGWTTRSNGTIFCESNSVLNISNSIFSGNSWFQSPDSADIVSNNTSTVNISNTITQALPYGNLIFTGVDPKFRDIENLAGPDGFYFTADDGLQLINPCSPGLNSGLNSAVITISTDMLGQPRLFGQVDLGPFEVQAATAPFPKTVYVNSNATGTNDGSSWTNAFTSLQKALQYCSDTVRVAAGTYWPSSNNPGTSFMLENKRVILGGYPAAGNPLDAQRNPVQYPTYLSGFLPGGTRSFSIVKGKRLNNSARLDGFIIKGAKTSYDPNPHNYGAGTIYLVQKASPEISNCRITDNNCEFGSGVVTKDSCNPRFMYCQFDHDTVTGPLSGAVVSNYSGSKPYFSKCSFEYNYHPNSICCGEIGGGAMFNQDAHPTVDSCIFYKNVAYTNGVAICNVNSNPIITNCLINGNMNGVIGGDIYNWASNPIIKKCVFRDSSVADLGGSIANLNGSAPLIEQCEFHNTAAITNGGAVYNLNSSPVFKSCYFYSKPPHGSGHATSFYNVQSTVKIQNCAIIGAYGFEGTAIKNTRSRVEITNCVIHMNYYIGNSYPLLSSVLSSDSCTTIVNNTIFWKNRYGNWNYQDVVTLNNPYVIPSQSIIKNSMLENMPALAGIDGNIINTDPQFFNDSSALGPDGIFFTADDGLRLQSCSPAVNSGSNALLDGLTTDIMGEDRVQGGTVDRGVYEFNGSPSISLLASDSSICTGTAVLFTANAFNQGANPAYQWQLNGNNIAATGNTYTSSTLANNDRITVTLTSNAACLQNNTQTSAPIIMKVTNMLIPAVSISGQTQITAGQQVMLLSSSANAGIFGAYQWQDSTTAHTWAAINGANLASITYTAQPGNKVRLRLTSSEECANPKEVTSNVLRFEVITAIRPEPALRYGIKVYPNPAHDLLTLDSLKLSDRWKTLELISSTGQSVIPALNIAGKERFTISLNQLKSGYYLIILRNEKHQYIVQPLIKQ